MTSQTLREARKYEETVEKQIAKDERPDFHLCSRVGWMNDPNGFCYYTMMVALGTCGEQRPFALGISSGSACARRDI